VFCTKLRTRLIQSRLSWPYPSKSGLWLFVCLFGGLMNKHIVKHIVDSCTNKHIVKHIVHAHVHVVWKSRPKKRDAGRKVRTVTQINYSLKTWNESIISCTRLVWFGVSPDQHTNMSCETNGQEMTHSLHLVYDTIEERECIWLHRVRFLDKKEIRRGGIRRQLLLISRLFSGYIQEWWSHTKR